MSDSPSVKGGAHASFVERLVPGDWAWSLDICAHAHRYRYVAQFVSGKRVLDAGCGVGYGSRMLASLGAAEVVAVDISEEALSIARQQFSHSRVEYLQDDCEVLANVPAPFDVIVCLENLEHLNRPERFLARAAELLSPDGVLVCSTPHVPTGADQPENPYHVHEYSVEQFDRLLHACFSDVLICGQDITAAVKAIHALWSNPLVRLGRWLQSIRGRRLPLPGSGDLPFSEGDFVISEFNLRTARVLVAVCGRPL